MSLEAMKCPDCGAQLHFSEDQDFCFCSHCGTQVYKKTNKKTIIYKEIDEARIKEAEAHKEISLKRLEYKERAEKRNAHAMGKSMSIMMCMLLVSIIACIFLACRDQSYKAKGYISVGNYSDYKGKNYEVVIAELKELGFSDIEAYDLNDAGLFKKENTIDTISIGGDANFSVDDWFSPDSKVIISYH